MRLDFSPEWRKTAKSGNTGRVTKFCKAKCSALPDFEEKNMPNISKIFLFITDCQCIWKYAKI
jgi:hypothetical protein